MDGDSSLLDLAARPRSSHDMHAGMRVSEAMSLSMKQLFKKNRMSQIFRKVWKKVYKQSVLDMSDKKCDFCMREKVCFLSRRQSVLGPAIEMFEEEIQLVRIQR